MNKKGKERKERSDFCKTAQNITSILIYMSSFVYEFQNYVET